MGPLNSTSASARESESDWTATEVVQRIRAGDVTAEAYCRLAIESYENQKRINAITWFDETRVIEAARAIDRARAAGDALGPLAGLPVVVKDNIDTVGFPSTAGTPSLTAYRPKVNAPVVDRLLECGAIIFGKVNMHELASGGTTNNQTWGPTRNPYNHNHVPGGSSGGTAAAIAARIVPAGLGSDTLGSTRIPASFCGIAGMRPSLAPSSIYLAGGISPILQLLDTGGPMARTVTDLAHMHAALTGGPVAGVTPVSGVRLGIPRQFYWEGIDAEVDRVAREALSKLRDAGAVLVDIDATEILKANEVCFSLSDMRADFSAWLAKHCPTVSLYQVIAGIKSETVRAFWHLDPPSAAALQEARESRDQLRSAYQRLFTVNGIAAIVYPTTVVTAMQIRTPGDRWDDVIQVNGEPTPERFITVRNTSATGVYDAPGISLPAGLSNEGLPVGLDLDGLPGGDEPLLALCRGVETVLGTLPPPGRRA